MNCKQVKNNVEIYETDISLEKTFTCGQCFRWHEIDGKWFGIVNGKCAVLSQLKNGIIIENTTQNEVESFWLHYLGLDNDYSCLLTNIHDNFICEAAKYGNGIYILNQDPLETVISFIISANNNIKRIEGIVERFCEKYGKPILFRNNTYYAFPTAEDLASVTLEGLADLRAGFRDKYIMDFVRIMCEEPDFLEKVAAGDTVAAKKELLRVKGIGDKVSDCILLFSFNRGEVFPKDVWIKKAVNAIYGDGFDEKTFGNYAGIAQQYIFYYARSCPEILKGIKK